jgi:hypothetical protein
VGNKLEDARQRFRSVLRLNILLSTINNGHPTLQWKASDPPEKRENQSGYDLLKYVTTILVRNSEVVAAVAHKAHPSSTGSFSHPASYQVDVMRTEKPANSLRQDGLASGTCQTDQGEALFSAFNAVANPYIPRDSDEDPYFKKKPPGVNCLMVPGESHFKMDDAKEDTYLERILNIP